MEGVRGGGRELHLGDDGVDVVHDEGDDAGEEGAIFTVSHQELEDTQEPAQRRRGREKGGRREGEGEGGRGGNRGSHKHIDKISDRNTCSTHPSLPPPHLSTALLPRLPSCSRVSSRCSLVSSVMNVCVVRSVREGPTCVLNEKCQCAKLLAKLDN